VNTAPALPPVLDAKLRRLQGRLRAGRLLRSLAGGAIVLAGLLVAAFLYESIIGWSVNGLRGANIALIGVILATGCATLAISMKRLPWPRLAILVERRYPELGERLISTVDLAQAGTAAHGSPRWIHWLREETAARAAPLDFRQACPLRPTYKLSAAAFGVLLLACVPLLASDSYARFGKRLLLAWTPAAYGYDLTVEPGNHFVGRGRSAAITARLAATENSVAVPSQCMLIVRADGAERRLRMEPLEAGAFSFTWPELRDTLEYRVEAGDRTSETYRLEPVDPVALVPGSSTAKVTPPPYVRSDVLRATEHAGPASFTALQFSQVQFSFAFDRPAQKATIRWRTGELQREIPLALDDNRTRASWRIRAFEAGPHAATLTVEAEHGILSTYPLPSWSIWTDDAPWFGAGPVLGRIDGEGRTTAVTADDVIPIKAAAEDQVGLGWLELEYRVNGSAPQTVLVADGEGQPRLDAELAWRLKGLVKVGDMIEFRLRLADNRRLKHDDLPPSDRALLANELTPHVVYLPDRAGQEDRWWTFKIETQALPLAKQETLAQRDEFQQWIDRIKKQLEQERQQVQKVKLASHQQPVLSVDQTEKLAQARKLNETNQQELQALAQKAAQVPGWQSLARLSFDISRRELGESDRALAAGQAKNLAPEKREQELQKADQALATALKRFDELHKMNELLAQERLDVQDLEKLAQREDDLAKQAENLAKESPTNQEELDRLRAAQAKIAAQLQQLAEKNPRLQQAALKSRQAQAQKLVKQAQDLAAQQRKLTDDDQAQWQAELTTKFAGLAQKQRDLGGQVEKLGRDLKNQPASALFETPHHAALDAADRLHDGRVESALAQQQNVENELHALAEQLDKAMVLGRDPRSAVQKLARMQDELLKRLEKLGEDFAHLSPAQTKMRLADIAQSQKMLHDAVGKLDLPKAAATPRPFVQELTGAAVEMLERKDALTAFQKMEQARDALQAWARGLPETAPPAPPGKATPEELAVRQQAGRAQKLAKDQAELREAVGKLLTDLAKTQNGSPRHAQHKDNVEKLAQQLMNLAQQAGPEAKRSAADAAHAGQMAQQALEKSQSEKQQGRMEPSKQQDAEAARQLDMAGKKLDEAGQAMSGQSSSNPKSAADDGDLQKSFQESQMKLDRAQQQLTQQPKDASAAMQQAANALKQTAQQAARSAAAAQPMGGADPAQRSYQGGPSASPDVLPESVKAHAGKAWGELPGELRTRIVQDLRARYGDEYGPIIQRYFQQIADVPKSK
jgi:hypothetical protein